MATVAGTITGFLRLDSSQFIRNLRQAQTDANATGSRIGRIVGNIGQDIKDSLKVAAGAFAVTKIADFFKDTIKSASDLEESTNKVQQIFKDTSPELFKFAEGAAKSIGISNVAARDAAGTFGTFGSSAGLAGQDLRKFSERLVVLSSDLASFYNTSPADAIRGIASALRGESEPIRAYGVLLNEVTLRTEGVKLGLIATTKEALTPQQRVLAAYNVVLAQTTYAQGDFQRTSHLLANQMRITSASFEDTKAAIGETLLPTANQFFGVIQTAGLPALQLFGTAISTLLTVLGPIFSVLGDLINIVAGLPGPILAGVTALGLFIILQGPLRAAFLSIWSGLQTVAINALYAAGSVSAASGIMARAAVVAQIAGKGFLAAFGGPIGLAITGITVGLGFLFTALQGNKNEQEANAEATARHEEQVANIAQSLDQETGALTRATRAQIIDRLEKQGSLKALQELGISSERYVDAILGSGDATKEVTDALKNQAKEALNSSAAYAKLAPELEKAGISQDQFIRALETGDLQSIAQKLSGIADSAVGVEAGLEGAAIGAQAVSDTNVADTFTQLNLAAGPSADLLATLGAVTYETADALDSGARKAAAMGEGALGANGEIQTLAGGLEDTAKAVSPFEESLKAADEAADDVGEAVDFLIQKIEELRGGLDEAAANQREADAAFRAVAEAARGHAESLAGVTQAQIDVERAAEDLTKAQENLGKSQDEGGTTANDVTEAQLALEQALRDQEQASVDVTDATDDMANSGDEAREAALKQAGAAYQTTAATGDLNAAVKAASDSMQVQRDRFIASQSAADQQSGAAARLADQLGLIPSDVVTIYTAPGSPYAIQQAADLKAKLDAIPLRKDVAISVQQQGIDLAQIRRDIENIPSFKSVRVEQNTVQYVTQSGLIAKASGGEVRGPGTTTSDSILARLSDKEIVIRASRAQQWRNLLLGINAGMDPYSLLGIKHGYASGGEVGNTTAYRAPTYSPTPIIIQQSSSGGGTGLLEIRVTGDSMLAQMFRSSTEAVLYENQAEQGRTIQYRR